MLRRTCYLVHCTLDRQVLPALSTSDSRVYLVPSQVPITKVLKETLFSHRKCSVRMARCLLGFVSCTHCHCSCQSPFICPPSLAARKDYAVLLRDVSRPSAGKGRAVLEYFGSEVERFYDKESENKEEAVQSGLLAWARGEVKSYRPTTWEVLIGAMKYADISVCAIEKLKEEL